VLRQSFKEQDQNYAEVGVVESSTAGLISSLERYLRSIIMDPHGPGREGYRLTLASLSGDGYFASLIYRRAQRRSLASILAAHEAARKAGDVAGEPLDIANINMFVEHIGTMINAIMVLDPASRPYANDGEALLREALIFCLRGLGLTEIAIKQHLPA
jgi:hypothetical protein